ncbi:MAG: esterase/lipase family protein [Acidimicrobiia bacterium]
MFRSRGVVGAIVAVVVLAGWAVWPAEADSAKPAAGHEVVHSLAGGVLAAGLSPLSDPPGSNDYSCRPSVAHPRPVVLVHGTFANMTLIWRALSPVLANDGYCVFAFNYGGVDPTGQVHGIGPIERSAQQLADFVDVVLANTGAEQVDLVGLSQGGGAMPHWYLKMMGGAAKVRSLVALAPSNHGTDINGLAALAALIPGATATVGQLCAACEQQLSGSPFMESLNAAPDTVPGVSYTVIATRYDQVVTPYTSQFLTGPDVDNITLQDGCELDLSEHLALPYSRVALGHVRNALDPTTAVVPECTPVLPVLGG